MKIAESALMLQSEYSFSQRAETSESLRVWVGRPAAAGTAAMQSSSRVDISHEARQKLSDEAATIEDAAKELETRPEMQLIKSLIEMLTGHKIRVFDPGQLKAPEAVPVPDPNAAAPNAAPRLGGFGVEYDYRRSYSESRTVTLQAQGVVKTSDGKEISFDLKLAMSWQYSETSSSSVRIGDAARKIDPLVLNFNGTAAQLSDRTFAFDLNGDGEVEDISLLRPGNGFLALDKDGNGKIDSGKELFGPASGDGFRELAEHDSDGNGWIDEADPVFDQLKIWLKDEEGDRLSGLAALGVGALSLHATSTPFDLKTADNRTLGSVRDSGLYLNEDGSAGSLQQLDLAA